jgi:hypothetical protein
MGRILDLAKRDVKRHVTRGGFEVDLSLSLPDNSLTIQTTGYGTKHWITYDTEGNSINSKNVHICIDEDLLEAQNYAVRNNRNEVSLINHRVSFQDSTGTVRNYIVRENYPDETFGLIVCILGDFTA